MYNYSSMLKAFAISTFISMFSSLTLWIFVVAIFIGKANLLMIVSFVLFYVCTFYFQMFYQLERRELPTPRFYQSGIPMFLSTIGKYIVIGLFVLNFFKGQGW